MSKRPAGERANVHEADPKRQVADHIDACRQRIPEFVDRNYAWPGAISLNRPAWGTDVLLAPFNFIMGFPNFVLRVLAALLDFVGIRKAAQGLRRRHLGLPTRVQKTLTAKLMAELLDLPTNADETTDRSRELVALSAQEPVRIYVQTRNVAADITAGTLAAFAGVVFLNQFTPGSFSAGSAIAHAVATEQAGSTKTIAMHAMESGTGPSGPCAPRRSPARASPGELHGVSRKPILDHCRQQPFH